MSSPYHVVKDGDRWVICYKFHGVSPRNIRFDLKSTATFYAKLSNEWVDSVRGELAGMRLRLFLRVCTIMRERGMPL